MLGENNNHPAKTIRTMSSKNNFKKLKRSFVQLEYIRFKKYIFQKKIGKLFQIREFQANMIVFMEHEFNYLTGKLT